MKKIEIIWERHGAWIFPLVVFTTLFLIFIYGDSGIKFLFGKSKEEKKNEDWKIEYENGKRLDSLNLDKGVSLAESYNAYIYSPPEFQFTYQLEEAIESKNNLFSFQASINDISKKDSTYILHLGLSFYGVAEIEARDTSIIKLDPSCTFEENISGYFIAKVSNISTVFPFLISRVNNNDPDLDDGVDFDNNNKHYLKITGELVDFILIRKEEKDNILNYVKNLRDEIKNSKNK